MVQTLDDIDVEGDSSPISPSGPLRIYFSRILIGRDIEVLIQGINISGLAPFLGIAELAQGRRGIEAPGSQKSSDDVSS